jgi:hypothetical protein
MVPSSISQLRTPGQLAGSGATDLAMATDATTALAPQSLTM